MAESIYILGRVTNVVLGPELSDNRTLDPLYNDPTDIGKIEFVIVNSPQYLDVMSAGNPIAKPAWPHIKCLPLIGEYVYIIPGPGVAMSQVRDGFEFYYLPPFGLWNSPHHNASPSLTDVAGYYDLVDSILSNTSQDGTPNTPQQTLSTIGPYPLGYIFPEKSDVRTLRQFVGDITLEGRWGNSIRFGSSIASNATENGWSRSKENGDPITIIRNGQGPQTDERPWWPAVEDIDTDGSSIYLTSTQEINVKDIGLNFSLISFGVKLGVAAEPTKVQTLTQPLISSDQLSPQYQDNNSLSYEQRPQDSNVNSTRQESYTAEELDAMTIKWKDYYKNGIPANDDGFDAFYKNVLLPTIPNVTTTTTSWSTVNKATQTIMESDIDKDAYDRGVKGFEYIKKKIDAGLWELKEVPQTTSDIDRQLARKYDSMIREIISQNLEYVQLKKQ